MAINIQIVSVKVLENPNWLEFRFYEDSWSKSDIFKIQYNGIDISGSHYFTDPQEEALTGELQKAYGYAPFDEMQVKKIFKEHTGNSSYHVIRI